MSMLGDIAVEVHMKKLKKFIETLDREGKTPEQKIEKINKWLDDTIHAAEDGWL